MRLIDADLLMENIVHLNNVYVQGRMAYIIDNQKIAFDKEKVVSELESIKSRYGKEDFSYIGIIEKAIEIVKKGGV